MSIIFFLERAFSSNLIQTFATFLLGFLLYLILQNQRVFSALALIFSLGIFLSFLFDIGEVYSYTYLYKRAFFVFGDDITTVLIFLFLYSASLNKKNISILSISAVFMSGGKVSYVLLSIMLLLILIFSKRYKFKAFFEKYIKYVIVGILVYFSMIGYARVSEHFNITNLVQTAYVKLESTLTVHQESIAEAPSIQRFQVRGRGACTDINAVECFGQQLSAAFGQRYYSSLAGLWMTLEGGFRGERYPNTADQFSSLMMQENPWIIIYWYELTELVGRRFGQVQYPFLRFGSGYGVAGLSLVLLTFGILCFCGFKELSLQETQTASIFTIFFIVNVIFNQTQSWLLPRSLVLLLTGAGAAHIVINFCCRRLPTIRIFNEPE